MKMMRFLAVAAGFGLTLWWGAPLAAQETAVTGIVMNEAGTRLPNVQVSVPGTPLGALTGANGVFTLNLAPGTHTLRLELIGYSSIEREIEVGPTAGAQFSFRMSVSAVELDQIVVSLDASQASRAEIGTDLERFNAELEVNRGAVTDMSSLLTSRAPSLAINASSGSVGSGSTIRVRGSTSLTQDNNPIIYVDGIRVSNATGSGPGSFDFGNGQTVSRLDDINPQDIASVQVMKGPAAAALYGSEAAAGVILIETKRGQAGQQTFSVNMETGLNRDVSEYWDNYFNLTSAAGVTDPADPRFSEWRPVVNEVTGDVFARHNPMENPFTNPRRDGIAQRYTINARGGSDAVTYFSSVRYEDEQGTLQNNELERISFRANVTTRPSESFDVDVSTSFVDATVRLPDNDRSAVGIITNAGAGLPQTAIGDQGGCLAAVLAGGGSDDLCTDRQGNLTANFDKLATIENTQDVGRFTGSITANWRPMGWFSSRGTVGLDYVQTANRNLVPLDPDRPFGSDSNGLINDTRTTDLTFSAEAAGTAVASLSDQLELTSTIGGQFFSTELEAVGCTGEGGFASPTAIACDASLTFTGFSDRAQTREVGAYLQERLGINDNLFLAASVRWDDNSSFGENQDAIWSPSASVSAVLSRMDFWSIDAISDFRVRMAWGKAAQAPSPFAASQTFRPVRLEVDGSQVAGISPLSPGNPDLAPERNEELEIGFDAALLDNRLSLKFTYFDQVTSDAIVSTNVAPSSGFSGSKFVNLGRIENNGWEATLGGVVIDNSTVSWDLGLRLSTNNPVVTSLGGEETILFGLSADHQMFREGYSPGAYYGIEVESAERDADGNIIPSSVVLKPGNVGPGGAPDPAYPNHRYLGDAEASNQQSLSSTLSFGGALRIHTLFDRSGGFSKFDSSMSFRSPFIPNASGSGRYALRQAESSPQEQYAMESGGELRNSVFIEPADFIKWRELSVSYQVPAHLAAFIGGRVQDISIAVGGRNLATFSDYSGLDPELRYDGGRDSFNAAEFFTQPPPRSFFFRLNFSF